MLTNLGNKKIPKEVIEEKFLIEMHEAYRNLREKFLKLRDEGKITQQLLVTRLGWDKSLVSKRLHGRENLTFKTLSALATAMECKLDLRWIEYSELTKHNE
jgi:transcriptional regulator with XRE-family HTH domain